MVIVDRVVWAIMDRIRRRIRPRTAAPHHHRVITITMDTMDTVARVIRVPISRMDTGVIRTRPRDMRV